MWSIETDRTFPLASVKPLDEVTAYRERCLAETRAACRAGTQRRIISPITGVRLESLGAIEGFEYLRCPDTGSLFLAALPSPEVWARLLADMTRHRQSPGMFPADLAQTRNANVHEPKIDWIQSTLRMRRLEQPAVMEVATPPSQFTAFLTESGLFSRVVPVNEMELAHASGALPDLRGIEVAVLLESLDRVDDPVALLRAAHDRLASGGLIFLTALVSSGFDLAVLGLANKYLYPPDRTNCFSVRGLERLLTEAGFALLEVSTPGVLDVEIVQAHLQRDPALALRSFERQLLAAEPETRAAFQTFLQQHRLSSFARLVGRKTG